MLNSLQKVRSDESNQTVKNKFVTIFHDFWLFTLGDKDKCSFFIQYYYSYYYSNHSEEERKAIYRPLLDLLAPVFSARTDPWAELNHMYDFVFPKLLRVIRKNVPESEETEREVLNCVFGMIEPQLQLRTN